MCECCDRKRGIGYIDTKNPWNQQYRVRVGMRMIGWQAMKLCDECYEVLEKEGHCVH